MKKVPVAAGDLKWVWLSCWALFTAFGVGLRQNLFFLLASTVISSLCYNFHPNDCIYPDGLILPDS